MSGSLLRRPQRRPYPSRARAPAQETCLSNVSSPCCWWFCTQVDRGRGLAAWKPGPRPWIPRSGPGDVTGELGAKDISRWEFSAGRHI